MRTINTFKTTKSFCINSVHAKNTALIYKHFGDEIVCIAYDNKDRLDVYTVRIINTDIMADYLIETICGKVEILDQVITRLDSNYAKES